MRKYHHIGIPTDRPRENETFHQALKLYTSGYEASPYGIEWMRFETDSAIPELVREVPHVAFEVDDLDAELKDRAVLIEPNCPSEGVLVAFIVDNGAPVEFLQFEKPGKLPGTAAAD